MSKARKKVSRGKSKKLFSKTGSKTHVKNVTPPPSRGGYRL